MKINKVSRLVALAVVSMSLTACGGSDNNTTQTTPAEQAKPPVTSTPSGSQFPVQSTQPKKVSLAENGTVFTSEFGLSLYVFANDPKDQSVCNAEQGAAAGSSSDSSSCAAIWPPLLAEQNSQTSNDFSIISRDDGTLQWALHGRPLYQYVNDSSEGDINGDGLNNIWHLARPRPVVINEQQLVGNDVVRVASSASEVIELARIDKTGFSLYTFDVDAIDTTNCTSDQCVNTWPPLMADQGAHSEGLFSLLSRNDSKQWAYNGKPLYFFASDQTQGDKLGDNVGNVWHLATTEPAIFRTNDAGTLLTASGKTSILAEDPAAPDSFITTVTSFDQHTLYTFDNDANSVSNCSANCAVTWPPFLANVNSEATGDFSIFTREDGTKQWAYQQQPLYFFANDTDKAQANGDGLGGVWHIIKPAAKTQLTSENSSLGDTLTVTGSTLLLVDDGSGNFIAQQQDKTGFALYTFNADSNGSSSCISAACITAWPPLIATSADKATGSYSIIDRNDGFKQWAVNGKPLYFFSADSDAQATSGEGVGDVWYVARSAPVRLFNDPVKGAYFVANGLLEPSIGKTAEALQTLSLYTFDVDQKDSGESSCFAGCAATWPPLYANDNDQATGLFSIITRNEDDGSSKRQWAYKGKPLYFFTADQKLGDTFGDYAQWPLARQ